MNGEKMTTAKNTGAKRVTQKARLQMLEERNATLDATVENLKATVEKLKGVNAEQLKRLVNQDLLRAHADELKRQLKQKGDD